MAKIYHIFLVNLKLHWGELMLSVLTMWNKIKIKDTTDGFKPILEKARPLDIFPQFCQMTIYSPTQLRGKVSLL